jgi:beta-xylosidase
MNSCKALVYIVVGIAGLCMNTCFSQTAVTVSDRRDALSKVWVADGGDGTYKNPILYADYSDPDVIRVSDEFYMAASSFNCVPGLPILHSGDLVNWSIIGYALKTLFPLTTFDKPQHGNGVWAPSIRHHNGKFFIYYGDPDFGIYLVRSEHPEGPWQIPCLVKAAKGWIDPCPFWDDDGNVYLVHAFAASRAGIKSVLMLHKMNSEGTEVLDKGVLIFDGHDRQPTIEGPKMYKRNGFYYIFAPSGGVKTGWQTVLRSKNIYGPYEDKIVMDQGNTATNGPHQGAWIELASGESWFIHFQDREAYGRVVHLQPMTWIDSWPVIGIDKHGFGKGEPVVRFNKPHIDIPYQYAEPHESDEFNSDTLGLQWQWHANPQPTWVLPSGGNGCLKLNAVALPEGYRNFWSVPNLMLQKLCAPDFIATTKIICHLQPNSEKAGLIIMGTDYACLSVKANKKGLRVSQTICRDAQNGNEESEIGGPLVANDIVYLRVKIANEALCTFSCSTDGQNFTSVGVSFKAKPGKWIGAKVGIFSVRTGKTSNSGYADFDWFRIERF